MPRIETLRHGSFLAAFALVLGACSFFSDFPEVSELGAGGSPAGSTGTDSTGTGSTGTDASGSTSTGDGGATSSSDSSSSDSSSSTGGAPACFDCEVCFAAPAQACPDDGGAETFQMQVNASALPEPPSEDFLTAIWVNDIASFDDGSTFHVGHASSRSEVVVAQLPRDTLSPSVAYGTGFVLDATGDLVIAAGPCTDGGAAFSGEVFFHGAAIVADDHSDTNSGNLVVAGAFEAGSLRFHDGTLDCATKPDLEAVLDAENAAAFLAWIEDGEYDRGIATTDDGISYFADVAAFPGAVDGKVAAIGVGADMVFGDQSIGGDQFFVLLSDGNDVGEVFTPGFKPCDGKGNRVSYSGLRSSIAVDADEDVWIAGTGCPEGGPNKDHQESFIIRVGSDGLEVSGVPDQMVLGDGTNPVGIREIAVDGDLVFVAGTYTGTPRIGDSPISETGEAGDGFVMALDRATWNDGGPPVWFTYIRGGEPDVIIRDVKVRDGRLFIAGEYPDFLAVNDFSACIDFERLRSRAFFAELDRTTGDALWIRLEGFAEEEYSPAWLIAMGTAIDLRGEEVLTATRTHGVMELACRGSTTHEVVPHPLATVRTLSF